MYIKLRSKLVLLTQPGPPVTLNKDTAVIGSLLVGQTGGTKAHSTFYSSKHVRILPGERLYGYLGCMVCFSQTQLYGYVFCICKRLRT